MRMKSVKLKNFRSYQKEISIEFENLTAFVGKNDIGKSSILDALDIFFNDKYATIKIGYDDVNISSRETGDTETVIAICFDMLPASVIIDTTNETTLEDEYLLNSDGLLEIIRKYQNGGAPKVFIRANHPTHPVCQELLQKKISELQKILEEQNIVCDDRTRKAVIRHSIRDHYNDDLQLDMIDIPVLKEDAKSIWDNLQTHLPLYTLFKADRKNCEGDSEVQDPLKEAVKEILKNEILQTKLAEVAEIVDGKLREVSRRTLEKIQEMSPDIATSLNPVIPEAASLKWQDVFKGVSITSDEDIPLDKRGSGVKRLILLSFFRAEAERRLQEGNNPSIIYAIEEPETSQHAANQKKLIRAFKALANADNTQILITTHSSTIVKQLDFINIKLIRNYNNQTVIETDFKKTLPYPSLNEINYLAFDDILEEYHNELFGYIDERGLLDRFRHGRPTMRYIKLFPDGTTQTKDYILTEYIRHQIHHPENTHNPRFTDTELASSISVMREFIKAQREVD